MTLHKKEAERLDEILSSAVDAEDNLNEWENGFIAKLVDHREAHGDDIYVSPKMWAVLETIEEKVAEG